MNRLLNWLAAHQVAPGSRVRTIGSSWGGKRRPCPSTRLALENLEDRTVLSASGTGGLAGVVMYHGPVYATNPTTSASTTSPLATGTTGTSGGSGGGTPPPVYHGPVYATNPTIPGSNPASPGMTLGSLISLVQDEAFLVVDQLSPLLHQYNPSLPALQLGGSISQLQAAINVNPWQSSQWGQTADLVGAEIGMQFLSTELP